MLYELTSFTIGETKITTFSDGANEYKVEIPLKTFNELNEFGTGTFAPADERYDSNNPKRTFRDAAVSSVKITQKSTGGAEFAFNLGLKAYPDIKTAVEATIPPAPSPFSSSKSYDKYFMDMSLKGMANAFASKAKKQYEQELPSRLKELQEANAAVFSAKTENESLLAFRKKKEVGDRVDFLKKNLGLK